jgi:predicted ArsR family transcriptional regulator
VAEKAEAVAGSRQLPAAISKASAEVELMTAVRNILRRELIEPRTEEEVSDLLEVTKPQAKAWLARLEAEAVVERVTKPKPVRFRTVKNVDRLL